MKQFSGPSRCGRVIKRIPLLALAVAAAGAVPAAADAATVTVDATCYRQATPIHFTLGGYAAGETVFLTFAGESLSSVEVGPDGSYAGSFQAPDTVEGKPIISTQLAGTDRSGNTASVPVMVSVPYVSVNPTNKTPSKIATITAGGFFDAPMLYAHYAYKKSDVSHPLRKTIAIGKPQGPCGTVTYRGKLLPIKKPKSGVWEIQVDGRSGFQRQVAPYAAVTTFVYPKRKG